MIKVNQSEATDILGAVSGKTGTSFDVISIKAELPTQSEESGVPVFGDAGKLHYGNLTGAGIEPATVFQSDRGQQYIVDESGVISEQRICFSTLECPNFEGTVDFEGFEITL